MNTKLPVRVIKAYGGIVRIVRGAKSTLYPKMVGYYYEYRVNQNRYNAIVRLIKSRGGSYNRSLRMYVLEVSC